MAIAETLFYTYLKEYLESIDKISYALFQVYTLLYR